MGLQGPHQSDYSVLLTVRSWQEPPPMGTFHQSRPTCRLRETPEAGNRPSPVVHRDYEPTFPNFENGRPTTQLPEPMFKGSIQCSRECNAVGT